MGKRELIDIYTDRFVHIGTMNRKEAHKKGAWHQVVACLAFNPKTNKAFFQRKKWTKATSLDDSNSPLDITVGGHFKAGEKLEDSIREISEELNQPIKYKQLFYLGIRQCGARVNENLIANEFHQVFLLPLEQDLEKFNVSGKEVGALVEVDIDKAIMLLKHKITKIRGKEIYYDGGVHRSRTIDIIEESFMNCWVITDQFILRLLIAAKRYIADDNKDLIMW